MKVQFLIVIVFSALSFSALSDEFLYHPENMSFDYGNLKHNNELSKKDPLSLVFEAGISPFSISVLFKQEAKNLSIEAFINKEKNNIKSGGYESETTLTKHVENNITAYEIIRNSKIGRINWYIFQIKNTNRIYSFWFVENTSLRQENLTVTNNYQLMKKSLRVVQ